MRLRTYLRGKDFRLIAVRNANPAGILVGYKTAHKQGEKAERGDDKRKIDRVRCDTLPRSASSQQHPQIDEECHRQEQHRAKHYERAADIGLVRVRAGEQRFEWPKGWFYAKH